MRAGGCRLNPRLESTKKTAQLTALIRMRMSPGVPNRPRVKETRSPWVTTNNTPALASAIPITRHQSRLSFKTNQPKAAMKTGVVATIQSVIEACAVTRPVFFW